MAFAVSRPARHSLRCLTTRQASLPLRTVQLLPHKGFRRWAPARPVSRPNRQPATGLPGDYPDRTHTGRRRRASDQVMTAGRSPPRSLDAPAAVLGDQIASTYDVLLGRSARVIAISDGLMSDRHAPVVLARIWRVQLVVMIGCLEGTATPALCRPAKTHVASGRNHRKQSFHG